MNTETENKDMDLESRFEKEVDKLAKLMDDLNEHSYDLQFALEIAHLKLALNFSPEIYAKIENLYKKFDETLENIK